MLRAQDTALDEDWSGDVVTIVAHDIGGIGGMERQLGELVAGLLARGGTVTVVSRTLALPPHERLHWRRVPGPARPFTLAYPWFALAASLILIRGRRGLVHTTGAIVLNRASVCTVHYLHNRRDSCPVRARRSTWLYRVNALAATAMSRLGERLVYSTPAHSRILVAVSTPLAEQLLQVFPDRADAIRVIENGVDAERFRPDETARSLVRQDLGIGGATKLALFVGSEWRSKGIEIAIGALASAPSWHLLAVGRGDTLEASRLAERLGVGTRLHLVSETPSPERYYAAADAFVLPSAYESFSIAAFEAAASGVPVLATDVGAVGEIVNAGGGVFVERSAESLGAALCRLEASPDSAAAMSRRARAAVVRFGWEGAVSKYADLYRQTGEIVPSASPRTATG